MKIEKDRVVRFHYAVAETGQAALENSKDVGEPLAILFGRGHIIPGLESAMEGREAGDSFKADVRAADAYGERRDGLTQRVPKKHFGEQKLTPGMQVVLQTNFGPRAVTIEKVGMSDLVELFSTKPAVTVRNSRPTILTREAFSKKLIPRDFCGLLWPKKLRQSWRQH